MKLAVCLLSILVGAVACSSKPVTPADPPGTPVTAPTAKPSPTPPARVDAVKPEHFVFVGRPTPPSARLDCDVFDTPDAPHRRPAERLHDATDFPHRYWVSVELTEIVQNPSDVTIGQHTTRLGVDAKPMAGVAFALGSEAFHSPENTASMSAYNAAWCRQINELVSAKFLVVHAFGVYVDRGNSAPAPWVETWHALGTDPNKANAGFDTLDEARAHARSLLAKSSDAKAP